MKAAFIFIYIWFLSLFSKEPEPKKYRHFTYTKHMYQYEFISSYNFSFQRTLQIVKDLIKISTACDVAQNKGMDFQYNKSIQNFTEKYRLLEKDESKKELTQWLHFYDEVKNDWFHYDQNLVLYYLEQAKLLLSIYNQEEQDCQINISSIEDLLEHVKNSVECIESYMLFVEAHYC